MSGSRLRQVADLAESWVTKEGTQWVGLLVARHGTVVLHKAWGRLAPEANSPPAPLNAIFPIASITKVLTATAILVLVEQGRVGLNRPVSMYIPEFHGEGKEKVLVRHLLTHTSGIQDEEVDRFAQENEGRIAVPPAEATLHPLMNRYLHLRYDCPLSKRPGEEMSYCGFGFELAADIVRRVSKLPFDQFARDRIFAPLGMTDTYLCRVDAPPGRRIRRPPDPENPPDAIDIAAENERLSSGAGYGLSTTNDLAVFGQLFLNGGAYGDARVLSPATVAAMTRNQIPGVGSKFFTEVFPEASWGYGWSIHGPKTGACGGLYSPESFEHWGGGGGAYFWVDPRTELIGVYSAVAPNLTSETTIAEWAKIWRNDLITDAATAAVVEA